MARCDTPSDSDTTGAAQRQQRNDRAQCAAEFEIVRVDAAGNLTIPPRHWSSHEPCGKRRQGGRQRCCASDDACPGVFVALGRRCTAAPVSATVPPLEESGPTGPAAQEAQHRQTDGEERDGARLWDLQRTEKSIDFAIDAGSKIEHVGTTRHAVAEGDIP